MDTAENPSSPGGSETPPWITIDEALAKLDVTQHYGESLLYFKDEPAGPSGIREEIVIPGTNSKGNSERRLIAQFVAAVLREGTWIRIK